MGISSVGVKPIIMSKEISSNSISENQHLLQGVHVVDPRHLLMRFVLIQKKLVIFFAFVNPDPWCLYPLNSKFLNPRPGI
jgi:hypothetical protein